MDSPPICQTFAAFPAERGGAGGYPNGLGSETAYFFEIGSEMRILRIPRKTSSQGSAFEKYPTAPALSILSPTSNLLKMEYPITCIFGNSECIARLASMPSMCGMLMSRMTASGTKRFVISTVECPSFAWPTTSMSPESWIRRAMHARTRSLSSAIRMRYLFMTCCL